MGWKLVRDRNEEWCRANGVSGQWRTSPDPASALLRKIFEEAGEYAEHRDPAELYDLLDVIRALTGLEDPRGEFAAEHRAKVAEMGGFGKFAEWCPVPAQSEEDRRAAAETLEALRTRLAGKGDGDGS
jgi:predicted house-cleaning noncanonical NTP pyrophosphatase (MazG superfamily)